MPKRPPASVPPPLDHYFSKELAGENFPSFPALRKLYDLACLLLAQEPWTLLEENQLVLLRKSADNELCCCSVLGALGEVYAMHVYIGPDSLRTLRKMEAGEITAAQQFFASQRSVFVEFVTRGELEKPDRELLAALNHPQGRGARCPIFRAIRPGFYPWFVTAEEAKVLEESIAAVSVVCSVLARGSGADLWEEDEDLFPLVSRVGESESDYRAERIKLLLPPEPLPLPARLDKESLQRLQNSQYAQRGVLEVDSLFVSALIGGKNERKAFTSVAMVVDAENGLIYASEMGSSETPPADAIAQALLKAIHATRALPTEVQVRQKGFKDSLLPLLRSMNVAVRVKQKLPALDEAFAALNAYMG